MLKLVQSYKDDAKVMHFMCPACRKHHHVHISGPGGWEWNLNKELPTLTPSIRVAMTIYDKDENDNIIQSTIRQVECHSWITNGKIKFFNDCYHDMAGTKWHELPDIIEDPQ